MGKDCQSCGNDAEDLDQEFLAIVGRSPSSSRPVGNRHATDADGEHEQTVVLTKEIVQMILNGTSRPSTSQIPILGMSSGQVSDWPKELEGWVVTACDLIQLAIRRPSVPPSGKSKTYYREQKKKAQAQCQPKPPKREPSNPPAVEDGLTYASRDRVIASLGYNTYNAYLKSETWTRAKMNAFHEKGSKCMWCNKPASTAHHSRYDLSTMKGIGSRHLWPICHGCHNQAELRGRKKTSLMEANARLGIMSDGTLCLKSRKRVVGIDKILQQASKGCNVQNLHHADHGQRWGNQQSPGKTAQAGVACP